MEEDFRERYEVEREDGSGATRATIRAFGFVFWEVLKAPAIASAAERLVAGNPDYRNLNLRKLPAIIAKCLGIRGHYGPVTSLALILPVIAHAALAVSEIVSSFQSQPSENIFGIAIRCLFCLFQRFSLRWCALPNPDPRFLYLRIRQIIPICGVPQPPKGGRAYFLLRLLYLVNFRKA